MTSRYTSIKNSSSDELENTDKKSSSVVWGSSYSSRKSEEKYSEILRSESSGNRTEFDNLFFYL